MSDRDLRALERDPSPQAALEHAHALRRAGASVAAQVAVLIPHRDDLRVREALGAYYTERDPGPEGTGCRYLPLDAPTTAPRARWTRSIPEAWQSLERATLHYSPLGLVVRFGRAISVLDPEDGALRWRYESPALADTALLEQSLLGAMFDDAADPHGPPRFAHHVLWVTSGDDLQAHDAYTGEVRSLLARPRPPAQVWIEGDRLVVRDAEGVAAYTLSGPDRALDPPRWTRSFPSEGDDLRCMRVASGRVVVETSSGRGVRVLDLDEGRTVGQLPVRRPLVDADGLVGERVAVEGCGAWTWEGEASEVDWEHPVGLAPERIFCEGASLVPGEGVTVWDRSTQRQLYGVGTFGGASEPFVATRNASLHVLARQGPGTGLVLEASDLTGEVLWEWPLTGAWLAPALTVGLGSRIFLLMRVGREAQLLCLEPDVSA